MFVIHRLQPLVARVLAGHSDGDVAEPRIRLRAVPVLETVRSPVTVPPIATEPSGRLPGERLRAGPPATAVPVSGTSSGLPSKSPAMPSTASSAMLGSGASCVGAKRTLTYIGNNTFTWSGVRFVFKDSAGTITDRASAIT